MDKINYIVIICAFIFGIIMWFVSNNLNYAIIGGVGWMLLLGLIIFFFEKHSQNHGKVKDE